MSMSWIQLLQIALQQYGHTVDYKSHSVALIPEYDYLISEGLNTLTVDGWNVPVRLIMTNDSRQHMIGIEFGYDGEQWSDPVELAHFIHDGLDK